MGARAPRLKTHGDDFAWSLLDAAPDATLVVTADGEIVLVNDRAGDLFGLPPTELLGRLIEDLLPEAGRSGLRTPRPRDRADPVGEARGDGQHLRARRGDGSDLPVEISLSQWPGDHLHIVAAIRPVPTNDEVDDRMRRVLRTTDAPWVIALAHHLSPRPAADADLDQRRRAVEHAEQAVQHAERAVAVAVDIAEDRARVTRDLHDTVVQRLYAAGLHLHGLLDVLHDPDDARRRVVAVIDSLDEAIRSLQGAVFSLRTGRDHGAWGARRQGPEPTAGPRPDAGTPSVDVSPPAGPGRAPATDAGGLVRRSPG